MPSSRFLDCVLFLFNTTYRRLPGQQLNLHKLMADIVGLAEYNPPVTERHVNSPTQHNTPKVNKTFTPWSRRTMVKNVMSMLMGNFRLSTTLPDENIVLKQLREQRKGRSLKQRDFL